MSNEAGNGHDEAGKFIEGNKIQPSRIRYPEELRCAFRANTRKALKALLDVLKSKDVRMASAKVRAAEIILNRGWGVPPQKLEVQESHETEQELFADAIEALRIAAPDLLRTVPVIDAEFVDDKETV
jgi:hypothetical protein